MRSRALRRAELSRSRLRCRESGDELLSLVSNRSWANRSMRPFHDDNKISQRQARPAYVMMK
jgi:hypothetical protein